MIKKCNLSLYMEHIYFYYHGLKLDGQHECNQNGLILFLTLLLKLKSKLVARRIKFICPSVNVVTQDNWIFCHLNYHLIHQRFVKNYTI